MITTPQIVNHHLLADLTNLGLWNEELKLAIISNHGSIQSIKKIPKSIKALYKTVWEISQRTILEMAADRGAFIDQSQSLNVHIAEPSMAKITSMHFCGWRLGLKTGMYYLRTKPAANAIQFTVDKTKLAAGGDEGEEEEDEEDEYEDVPEVSPKKGAGAAGGKKVLGENNTEIKKMLNDHVVDDNIEMMKMSMMKKKPTAEEILACSLENREACVMCSG